ncbi:MAG: MarR family transcriptional regulator [Ignavibacteria bacterium]|jgi:DNA-binding MarR family transcriptional regulator
MTLIEKVPDKKDHIGFLIVRARNMLVKHLHRNFTNKGYDLTHEQFSILRSLFRNDAQSQQQLANNTFRDKVSVTKIIDSLEKRKLVVRKHDSQDRRINKIVLTDDAKEIFPDLDKIDLGTIANATEGIPQNQIKDFKSVLNSIHQNLMKYENV